MIKSQRKLTGGLACCFLLVHIYAPAFGDTTDAQIGTVTQYVEGNEGNQYLAGHNVSVTALGSVWASDSEDDSPWDCTLWTVIRDAAGTPILVSVAMDNDAVGLTQQGGFSILSSTTTALDPNEDNWYYYAEIKLDAIPAQGGMQQPAGDYQLVEWFKTTEA